MPSPYSFKENILWLVKHISPDIQNETSLKTSFPSFINKNLEKEKTMKLVFVGDIMSMYFEKVPKCCYSAQSLLHKADYIIGNLEAPITKKEKGSGLILNFVFEFSEDYLLEFLDNFGIEKEKCVLTLGNNHISDHGEKGFDRTCQFLREQGIKTVGHYQHAPLPLTLVKDGLTANLFSWSEWMNFPDLSPQNRVCRNEDILSMPSLKDVVEFKEESINIGIPHWGYEFRHFPNQQNHQLSKQFLDMGFDFLIGHHPHVLGPFEKIPESDKFCFHSLGNFIGIQLTWPTKLTGMFEVDIVSEGEYTGKIKSYQFHPYFHTKIDSEYHLVDLDKLPGKLQNKCRERLKLLYGNKA